MSRASEPNRPPPLRDGPVDAAAVRLVCDLERRGIVLAIEGDELVVQAPDSTDADLDALRRLKRHLVAITNDIDNNLNTITQ